MSNEEAIKELKEVYNGLEFKYEITTANAFDSAISALETIDRIKAERDAAVEDLHSAATTTGMCLCCKYFTVEGCNKDKGGIICDPEAIDLWEWRGLND